MDSAKRVVSREPSMRRSGPRDSPRRDKRTRSRSRGQSTSTSPIPSPSSWTVDRGRSRVRRASTNSYAEDNLRRRGYHALLSSFGKIFHVERRWKLVREMGSGAYGVVISALDDVSGETVAIKLVTRVFEKVQLAKRALREITLLRHFANHENITGLIDVDAISKSDFQEIYIFMEPMEADLHQIIKSGQALTNEHVQYFLYQILRGMKYVHSASVVHRDLKPGNLLVNADCELKICDFGLSRGFDSAPDENATHLTEYVATRWYRAPEIMLAFRRYSTAIDVWSIGCILAELLLGKPLFKGKDYVDQLNKVLDVLGTPEEDVIQRIGSEKAQAYVRSLPFKKTVSFQKIIPSADPQAIDLLTRLLAFDPSARITVAEALAHPWLATYHDVNDEPECAVKFEKWRQIEELETLDEFREAIWTEIAEYRAEVRGLSVDVVSSRGGSMFRPREGSTAAEENVVEEVVVEDGEEEATEALDSGVGLENAADITKSKSRSPVKDRREREASLAAPPTAQDHLRPTTPTDPVVTYARRSSIMQPSRQGSTYNSPYVLHQPLPSYADGPVHAEPSSVVSGGSHIAFPSQQQQQCYVVPARSRTASMAGGEVVVRKLLRTLSTVSIHESGEGLPRYVSDRQTTGADAPASEMPREFGIEEREERNGDDSGSHGGEKRKDNGRFLIE